MFNDGIYGIVGLLTFVLVLGTFLHEFNIIH